MTPYTLKKDKSQLLIIDVQERLLPAIYDNTSIVRNIKLLLKAAQVLSIPTKYTEQYPKGLGPTVSDILELLPTETPRFEKIHFSCCDEGNFKDFLGQERKQVILAGIETHICILATTMDLLNDGYQVVIAMEGVGSRRKEHHLAALNVLSQRGAMLLPTESIIYQWLSKSGTPEFKEMLPFFKE
ncbi:hydrolase [Acetomicrobium sp.]|uniref:hydrolase n=1 Tax=Acetomicrobium sp. TaxID=1872099 RepID=UPI001BCBDEBF|nr:hydrolase [Acetomicrobium sp.]